jgi:hypothetical protein
LPAVFDFKAMNGTLQEKLTELCDLMEMMCSQEDVADMARSLETTQVYLQGLKNRRQIPNMRHWLYMHTLITLLVSRWHEFKPPSCKPPTFDLPSYEEATAFAV